MEHTQAQLTAALQRYMQAKSVKISDPIERKKCVLPIKSVQDMCKALTSLYLHSMLNGNGDKFGKSIDYVLNWSPDEFLANHSADSDQLIEEFINQLLHLQQDTQAEYSRSFVFNAQTLEHFLSLTIFPDKMVLVGNSWHVIGIYLQNGVYNFFDSKTDIKALQFKDLASLVPVLIKSLAETCNTAGEIALHFSIFDKTKSASANYSPAHQYINDLLTQPASKQAYIKHDHILSMQCAYHDYAGMNDLVAAGFKWDPNNVYMNNELLKAAENKDVALVTHLTQGLIPIDAYSGIGITVLGHAIKTEDDAMLLRLLYLGANPQHDPMRGYNSIFYSILMNNIVAIMTLLACGAKLSAHDLEEVKTLCRDDVTLNTLVKNILDLNAKIYHIQQPFLLDSADTRQLMGMAIRLNFALQVGYDINKLKVEFHGTTIYGEDIFHTIMVYMGELEQAAQLDLNTRLATLQIEHLVQHGVDRKYTAVESLQITFALDEGLEEILHKPLIELSDHQLMALQDSQTMLREVAASAGHNPLRYIAVYKAKKLLAKIEEYIRQSGFASWTEFTNKSNPEFALNRRHMIFNMPEHEPLTDLKLEINPGLTAWDRLRA